MFYILKLKTEKMLILYSAQSYSLWYQINVVPSHNLPRQKEPERLQSTCTQSKHFSDSDWHRWTKSTQNMFWVRSYFHFFNYLLWVFYYCLNENENIISWAQIHIRKRKKKKKIGNNDCHLHRNSDISAASQHANKHKENRLNRGDTVKWNWQVYMKTNYYNTSQHILWNKWKAWSSGMWGHTVW